MLVQALCVLRIRRLYSALALAFPLELGTNDAYLAQAVPADSATDNSSVFTFARTGAFLPGGFDMKQNYTPPGSATTCAIANASKCVYFSDQFSAGQTMNAGSAIADLYLSTAAHTVALRSKRRGGGNAASITVLMTNPVVQGDVLLTAISVRGGSGVTISPDPGWTLIRPVDNGTTPSLAAHWKLPVANEGSL